MFEFLFAVEIASGGEVEGQVLIQRVSGRGMVMGWQVGMLFVNALG